MAGERDIYFLSKNYVNADDTINVSSGALTKSNLYDQKYANQWVSDGETSETGYDTYIEVVFYEGSTARNRTIDTFVLQNINLKKFKIQYFTDGAYADVTGAGYTVNAVTGLRIKLAASITTSKVKILMESTIVAAEEKKIGQFWALLETYQLANPYTSRNRQDATMSGFNRLGDGTGYKWTMYDKWGKVYDVKDLTDTQLAALEAIYKAHSLFTIYENYTRDINSIRAVFWVDEFTGEDNNKIGMALNSLSITLVEK